MKSKGQIFNNAVLKMSIKRYGFIFAIYFFITEIALNYLYLGSIIRWMGADDTGSELVYMSLSGMNVYYILTLTVLSVVMGVAIFHYIHDEKALTSLHAMPVSRKSLYFTNYIVYAGLTAITLFADFVLTSVHLAFYLDKLQMGMGEILWLIFIQTVLRFIVAMAVFAFTVFIGMMVSNFILQIALVMVFFGVPAVIYQMANQLFNYLLVGYVSNSNRGGTLDVMLTPYYFLYDSINTNSFIFGIGYDETVQTTRFFSYSLGLTILMFVVSMVAGYLLYKKRDLESCHEFIAFKRAKRIITLIIALMLSLVFANMIGFFNFSLNMKVGVYIGAFIGSLLGYIIMKLIAEKSVNPLGFIPKGLIFSAIMVFILFLVDIDIMGYENHIPDKDEVEVVYIYENSWHSFDPDNADFWYEKVLDPHEGNEEIIKLSGDDLDELAKIHKELIAATSEVEDWSRYGTQIIYKLKNGSVVVRSYRDMGQVDAEFSKKLMKLRALPSNMAYLEQEYDEYIDNYRALIFAESMQWGYLDGASRELAPAEEILGLLEAYKQDELRLRRENKPLRNGTVVFSFGVDGIFELDVYSDYSTSLDYLEKTGHKDILDYAKNTEGIAGVINYMEIYVVDEGFKRHIFTIDKKRLAEQILRDGLIKPYELSDEEFNDRASYCELEIYYENGEKQVLRLEVYAEGWIKGVIKSYM